MRVMLEIRKKCAIIYSKKFLKLKIHILIFFLATFEVNYKEQKTRYIPTKPSDFKTTNDNFLW